MSDLESAAAPEVQAKAEAMGWIPATRYKGDPERFIDAESYLERGETVLPIVKEQNKRLQAELAQVKQAAEANATALKVAQDAIEQIEERHSVETQKAVERARTEVKAQLAAASAEGDHQGVAELTDQLTRLNAAEAEAGPVEKKQAAPAAFITPTDLSEWNSRNPWFGKDKRRTALALGIAQELRDGGEKSIGAVFYELVGAELEAMLGEKEAAAAGKVEGARNGSDNEPAAGGKKTFMALSKEAKEACDNDARQFVGPTKRYKDLAAWRARYAEIYFERS